MIETCLLDIRHLFVTDDKAIKFGSNLIKMNKQILGIFPTVTSIIVKNQRLCMLSARDRNLELSWQEKLGPFPIWILNYHTQKLKWEDWKLPFDVRMPTVY